MEDAGAYTVEVSNSAGKVTSTGILSVIEPSSFTKILGNLTVVSGSSLISGQFCVTASGTAITYSWTKNGNPAPYSANKPCYLATTVTTEDAGTYTVTAKNSAGTVTATAILSVETAPQITASLANMNVTLGSSLVAGQFCISASGSNLVYSWAKDGNSAPYNANKPCYLIPTIAASDAGSYSVTVSNLAGKVTATATLNIVAAPTITKPLAPFSIIEGVALEAGQFCITANGTDLSYSWRKDGNIAPYNANKPCYLVPSIKESDSGSYSVTVTNSFGSASSTAILIVYAKPVITKPLKDLSVNLGGSVSDGEYCVEASGSGLSYTWSKNGKPAPNNADKPCYSISKVAESDFGDYSVIVTNYAGYAYSSAYIIVVTAPIIEKQLLDRTALEGQPLSSFCISPAATFGQGYSYSWTKDGLTAPFNANSPCYSIPKVSFADAGTYSVKVSTSAGSATSTAKLDVKCSYGYYQEGTACIPNICNPGATSACSDGSGSGTKICNSTGSGYGTCQFDVCNSSYKLSGSQCVVRDPLKYLAAGANHTCGITPENTVKCSGFNSNGQLGNGSNDAYANYGKPVSVVGLSEVIELSAGYYHTCAIRSDRSLYCWGSNERGQIGTGDKVETWTPKFIAANVYGVSAGGGHTCAIFEGGKVKCWGNNNFGELGVSGVAEALVPMDVPGLSGIVKISADVWSTCALDNLGAVFCWGIYYHWGGLRSASPVPIPGISNSKKLCSTLSFSCVITATGGVKCWGDNNYGQLGNNSTIASPTPVDVVGLSGVSDLSCKGDHACVVTADKKVKCWGWNSLYSLGAGLPDKSYSPVPLEVTAQPIVNPLQTGTGNTYSCALNGDGRAACWGNGGFSY